MRSREQKPEGKESAPSLDSLVPAEGGQGPGRAGNGVERLPRWQHAESNTDELGGEDRLRKGPGFVWVTHGRGTTWEEGLVVRGGGSLQSPQVLQGPLMQDSPNFYPDRGLKCLSRNLILGPSNTQIPFQYPLSILPLHSRDHLRPPSTTPPHHPRRQASILRLPRLSLSCGVPFMYPSPHI